jgi:hypothetical protein
MAVPHGRSTWSLDTQMRALPADLDLSRLIGQQLQIISVGEFSLSLGFERDSISCEGRLVAEFAEASTVIFSDGGWGDASVLPKLVGGTVTAWAVEASHEFSISLGSEFKLRFTSEDSPYENFVIFDAAWVV